MLHSFEEAQNEPEARARSPKLKNKIRKLFVEIKVEKGHI